MLLCIDVGNTNIVFGLYDGSQLAGHWRVSTDHQKMPDEYAVLASSLMASGGFGSAAIEDAVISSVVPPVTDRLCEMLQDHYGLDALVVGAGCKTGVAIRVDNPREVGADRIVNTVAAFDRWGGPVIVVDFGTATTFDCVNRFGDYLGGVIAPGFKISEEALFERTAKLPRVSLVRPPHAIGTNTVHAMQSGLYFGYVGLVDGLARRCRAELGAEARVMATGGLARLIAEESELIEDVDAFLTLRGLAMLYERNR